MGPHSRRGVVSFVAVVWTCYATFPPPEGALRDEPKQRLRRRLEEEVILSFSSLFSSARPNSQLLSILSEESAVANFAGQWLLF